mmetsp:Transcript_47476/g.117538  ORF Transcript_47476/g.117538 Transcript_47476/m.117538 type:complete len:94 (+) Transcript_47476:1111-1392(+)
MKQPQTAYSSYVWTTLLPSGLHKRALLNSKGHDKHRAWSNPRVEVNRRFCEESLCDRTVQKNELAQVKCPLALAVLHAHRQGGTILATPFCIS